MTKLKHNIPLMPPSLIALYLAAGCILPCVYMMCVSFMTTVCKSPVRFSSLLRLRCMPLFAMCHGASAGLPALPLSSSWFGLPVPVAVVDYLLMEVPSLMDSDAGFVDSGSWRLVDAAVQMLMKMVAILPVQFVVLG
ncbi:hypothetical protein Nepgr_013431 [Nepenthes gracilis]|uniref:Uncharacterized protein n=1 Tax=Nepenthes gracilis TaxID=150966 RepID=A0AAD3SIT7_NEPGR|nr:hypothetical protein Nepgr_013431 [Nepenthes gracilis]